ncbi:sulfur carrier protein ThiS [Akkermansiaceae bacterium]|nr:sulfur carrier protein ThiS [Akkermansiaceae bacterium]MDB4508436.1 sulfur carrier protein ThiS [Akkermansiaceae bacterium]
MTLTINGVVKELQTSGPLTLSALLDTLGLAGKPVVVELNREALSPSEFKINLNNGDQLEVITIAAGG